MGRGLRAGLRFLRLLAIVVWMGGLLFFAAVLAPTAFSPAVIARTHSLVVSGTIVGAALRRLHAIGLTCGSVLLVAILAEWMGKARGGRLAALEGAAVALMLVLTAYSQFSIVPRMEVDRRAVGEIEDVPRGNPYRAEFDRLHGRSVQVESGVMLAGLGLLVLVCLEGWDRQLGAA